MKVAVVGCGVSGMAAALALARDGHQVEVFEEFAELRPIGSGLLLQPSGLEALRSLGLEEAVRDLGAPVTKMEGRCSRGRLVLDLDYAWWRQGAASLGVHRASLFSVLHDALEPAGVQVRRGRCSAGVIDTQHPRLRFSDGEETEPFDLVIAADGAGSETRPFIRPHAEARPYPWGAVWANCPDPEGRWGGALRQVYHRAEVMIGVLPIGRAPGSDTPLVSLFWSVPRERMGSLLSGDLDAWKAEVERWWPETRPLLDSIERSSALSPATYRDVEVGRWCSGSATLIGDAAHGTSPQLGQGANLGLVDGVELATAMREHPGDVPRALDRWQAARRRQTAFYQLASRALTPMFQSRSRAWPWLRDALLVPATRAPGLNRIAGATLAGSGWFGWGSRPVRL